MAERPMDTFLRLEIKKFLFLSAGVVLATLKASVVVDVPNCVLLLLI